MPTDGVPTGTPPEPHTLSPDELTELLAADDTDPIRVELRSPDPDEPDEPDHDRLATRLTTDSGWGLAFDDPYRWTT